MTVCYLQGNSFRNPLCVATWGFCVKCVSMFWEVTLKDGDELMEVKTVHRTEESIVFHQDFLTSL